MQSHHHIPPAVMPAAKSSIKGISPGLVTDLGDSNNINKIQSDSAWVKIDLS